MFDVVFWAIWLAVWGPVPDLEALRALCAARHADAVLLDSREVILWRQYPYRTVLLRCGMRAEGAPEGAEPDKPGQGGPQRKKTIL